MDIVQLDIRLARATTLPAFPNVVAQVLALSDDPGVGVRHYERLLSQDAALAAKILRTANSSYYGGNGNVTTLQSALVRLGVNTVRSICMTVAMQSAVSMKQMHRSFPSGRFWQHSMTVACAAKVLACLTHYPEPEEAFIAGLLHDIGRVAMALYLPEELGRIYEQIPAGHFADVKLEQELCGFTHEEVGQLAAQRWGLPPVYIRAIGNHHALSCTMEDIERLIPLVHVANALAHEIGLGWAAPGTINPCKPDPDMVAFLGLPSEQWSPVKRAVANEIARISAHMSY